MQFDYNVTPYYALFKSMGGLQDTKKRLEPKNNSYVVEGIHLSLFSLLLTIYQIPILFTIPYVISYYVVYVRDKYVIRRYNVLLSVIAYTCTLGSENTAGKLICMKCMSMDSFFEQEYHTSNNLVTLRIIEYVTIKKG